MARLLPADLAAIFVGVKPGTLRVWRHRGYLTPAGGTERRPLYSIVDLHEAKKATARGARKTAQKVAT